MVDDTVDAHANVAKRQDVANSDVNTKNPAEKKREGVYHEGNNVRFILKSTALSITLDFMILLLIQFL